MTKSRVDQEISNEPAPRSAGGGYLFAVLLVAAVVFFPVCTHEFTWWDDWATVHQNKRLDPPTWEKLKYYWANPVYGLYIPATYTAWGLIAYQAHLVQPDQYGIMLNPWLFHSANYVVHLTSSALAFLILRRLTKHEPAAMFGALLFAIHPVQLEAVAWVSGLKDVLAGCLMLAALGLYVASDRRDWLKLTAATVAYVLAMLAKPSAAMLPLIALGIDLFILRRRMWPTIAVWALLAVPILIIARLAQDVTGIPKAPLWARPLVAADTLAFYTIKLLFPIHLAPDYGRTPAAIMESGAIYLSWLIPACVLATLILMRRRAPWLVAAGWVFVASIAPVLGLTTFQFQFTSTVADHYLYFAMLGPALALGFALRELNNARAYTITALMLMLLAVRTFVLAPVWKDDITLFTHNLDVNPDSAVAYNNLGNSYKMRGDREAALKHFRRAMQLNPNLPNAFNNAALVLAEMRDFDGAIDAWERSVDIRARLPRTLFPDYMEDHNRIGQLLLMRGQYERAIRHFEQLLELKPDHEEAKKYLQEAKAKSAAGVGG